MLNATEFSRRALAPVDEVERFIGIPLKRVDVETPPWPGVDLLNDGGVFRSGTPDVPQALLFY